MKTEEEQIIEKFWKSWEGTYSRYDVTNKEFVESAIVFIYFEAKSHFKKKLLENLDRDKIWHGWDDIKKTLEEI